MAEIGIVYSFVILIGKDRSTIIILPRDEIFGVGDEFRISARAQFVKIHALAFSFKRHPEWTDSVERKIQGIGEGQHEAEQRRDAHELSQPLSGSTAARHRERNASDIQDWAVEAGENADRQNAPDAADGMHRNSACRIV